MGFDVAGRLVAREGARVRPARATRMRRALSALGIAVSLLASTGAAGADAHETFRRFLDPHDGYLDLSEWLLERKGFLPVPLIITEPAVGYGGGIALVFIRGSIGDAIEKAKKEGGHLVPPDIWVAAGFATENGTRGAAVGGQVTFDEDRWRYRGGVGDFRVNLDFYGIGGFLPIAIGKVGYTLQGFGSFQQGMYRLGASDTFIGARWIYTDLSTSLDVGAGEIGLTSRELAQRNSGLGVVVEHDSRDNIFTPNRGWIGAAEATFYDPDFGGANRFQAYRAHVFAYWPALDKLTVGLRIDGRAARGDVPFYFLPFIDMRGIPAARYQDQNTGVLETELRYDVTERWSVVGFIGAGRAWGRNASFADSPSEVSKGVGFRYLLARRLGLYVGIDVARGPEDDAFYLQVGNGWR